MKSIMQTNKECYFCHKKINLHKHHILKGIRNRKKSEEDGLYVYLCYEHHEGTNGVHGKNGHELDMILIRKAEEQWLGCYNKTEEDFIERYGKNYLS